MIKAAGVFGDGAQVLLIGLSAQELASVIARGGCSSEVLDLDTPVSQVRVIVGPSDDVIADHIGRSFKLTDEARVGLHAGGEPA